jgi:hypothetical protein
VWLGEVTGIRWHTTKATSHLKGLGIAELTHVKSNGRRGWQWRGRETPRFCQTTMLLGPLQEDSGTTAGVQPRRACAAQP